MKNSVDFGLNKTPTQLHPKMTEDMVTGYKEFPPHIEEASIDAFTMRKGYIECSENLGSVPVPSTLKGALNTGAQANKRNSPAILIDKLGERLAYERSGVRLYDALITKCMSADPKLSLNVLYQFRNEEAEHFALVRDCIISIGGDPTAQTPCADASGVAAMGLIQLVNDPRSTISQCVQAILIAELTDVAAWDLLIELVTESGLDEYVVKFKKAKVSEDHHLATIKLWLERMTLANNTVDVPH